MTQAGDWVRAYHGVVIKDKIRMVRRSWGSKLSNALGLKAGNQQDRGQCSWMEQRVARDKRVGMVAGAPEPVLTTFDRQ